MTFYRSYVITRDRGMTLPRRYDVGVSYQYRYFYIILCTLAVTCYRALVHATLVRKETPRRHSKFQPFSFHHFYISAFLSSSEGLFILPSHVVTGLTYNVPGNLNRFLNTTSVNRTKFTIRSDILYQQTYCSHSRSDILYQHTRRAGVYLDRL